MFDELLLTVLLTSVPLILAATGELVVERSGVLNLGVEGMMLMGAVAAFGAASLSGSPYIGIVSGGLAGMAVAAVFALFVLGLATNQVATGLALTIFGTGLSGLIGAPLVGQAIDGLPSMTLPLLSDIPLIGAFFKLDIMAYLSILIVALTSLFLMRSRAGLILRSVGINHDSAHALGYNVLQVRFFAILFGGFMAGLGGAYLPLVLTPHWAEGMTAGRGWIALALVVFASWQPWRVTIGAVLFGGVTIMQLAGQARGWTIPAQFLSMMPYLATIVVLVTISGRGRNVFGAPAHLGKRFFMTR
ncbi:MAG: ABC transporter permease [Alphaproteobacteria bacterium]|jgi:simple sugar transport system permease protein|nr:ABC transporter permease [Alphaproteobacteria bacterium]